MIFGGHFVNEGAHIDSVSQAESPISFAASVKITRSSLVNKGRGRSVLGQHLDSGQHQIIDCASTLTAAHHQEARRCAWVGMTGRQLTDSIGKPEVITKRSDGTEVWVYSFNLGVDAKSSSYVLKDGKVVEVLANSAGH